MSVPLIGSHPFIHITLHSTLRANLIKNWIPLTGPSQGDKALLGGSEYGLVEILQNGACQKNIKNLFDPWCSQLYKDSSQLYYDPALYSLLEKL